MDNDPEFQVDEAPEQRRDSRWRRRTESSGSRLLAVMLGVIAFVLFAGGIVYFITRAATEGGEKLQAKIAALEPRMGQLEKQVAEIQGELKEKLAAASATPTLAQRLDVVVQKVEALERRYQSRKELRTRPVTSETALKASKRYHTVHKGETLSSISGKYGIPVKELRRLNHLAANQPLHNGQKLLVSQAPSS